MNQERYRGPDYQQPKMLCYYLSRRALMFVSLVIEEFLLEMLSPVCDLLNEKQKS